MSKDIQWNKTYSHAILFVASLLVVVIIFSIPFYNDWITNKINNYYKEFLVQKNNLDIETRYKYRFGNNYTLGQNLKNYFDQNQIENPVLFLPPKRYLAKNREHYDWGECLSFYYFTGIVAVDLKSKNIHDASHAVIATNSELKIIEITDEGVRNRIIEEYRKYGD